MNYLHECCILLMEKSENLNSQTSVGISSGLDAVKSQNFSIFTGTTVDTAVGNLMNFVNWNETGLLKTRFLETLRLGEDKVKLACSLFSFNLFVKLFYFFFYFATLLTLELFCPSTTSSRYIWIHSDFRKDVDTKIVATLSWSPINSLFHSTVNFHLCTNLILQVCLPVFVFLSCSVSK